MAQPISRAPQRLCAFFMALVLLMVSVIFSGFIAPAQAAILPVTRTYIQTTIDPSSWEILAGVISYEAGVGGNQAESKRIGADTLSKLAQSKQPSSSDVTGILTGGTFAKGGGDTVNNLVLCFPGMMSFSGINDNSSADDTSRAQLIRNSLIYDLNMAFKFVYGDKYGNYTPTLGSGVEDTIDNRIAQYAKDMGNFLSHIPGSEGEFFGKNGAKIVATDEPKTPADNGITHDQYYVTIERDGEQRTFQYRMLKGYGVDGTGLSKVSGDATEYIHWGTLAVEAFINYHADEKLQVTAENLYEGTMSTGESIFAGILGGVANFIANTLGLWNFDELIFNSGIRGTLSYVSGVFPASWQPIIWTFFFISEIISLGLLLYAIIYNVGKKALSTVDPVARASAIEQIKYLFIVAFLLAIVPLIIPLLLNVCAELTGVFHDVLGGKTATDRFKKLASNSGGLGSILTYLVYLGALLYFNVFYVFRALSLALLIILAPIFIVMMALSENKRQLTLAWFREFCANLFIQPLQALMLSFILLVPDTGRNIDSIVMAYVMIPLTNLLRQMFFGNAGGLADQVGNRGKSAGIGALKFMGGVAGAAVGGTILGVAGGIKANKEKKTSESSEQGGSSEPAGSGAGTASTKTATGKGASGEQNGSSSSGSGTKESKQRASAAQGGGDPVSPGATGAKSSLSEAVAENSGNTDNEGSTSEVSDKDNSTAEGASGSSSDGDESRTMSKPGRVGRVAGGIAMVAAGGTLGMIGGAAKYIDRRAFGGAFGMNKPFEQLSAAAVGAGLGKVGQGVSGKFAQNSGTNTANQSEEKPAETPANEESLPINKYAQSLGNKGSYSSGDNIYTRGIASKTKNEDGTSKYTVDHANYKDAGISTGRSGENESVAGYNISKLSEDDQGRLEAMQNLWENGSDSERAGMEALGITGFTTQSRMIDGKEQVTGATVTYDNDKAKKYLGLQLGRDGYSMNVDGDGAPALVPDIPSLLNSPTAAAAFATSQMEGQGFSAKTNSETGEVAFTAKAQKFQSQEIPENLMPYFANAQVDKKGNMTAVVPQSDLVDTYGGIATNSNTQEVRMRAAEAAPEGSYIAPTMQATTPQMTSVGSFNGISSLAGQGLSVAPDPTGENFTITGSLASAQAAQIPAGLAPKFAAAEPDSNGAISVTVPKAEFVNSYSAGAPGTSISSIPMATAGIHLGGQDLSSQGVSVNTADQMVTISTPNLEALQNLNVPKPVAEQIGQGIYQDTTGPQSMYVAQIPQAVFDSYAAPGGNAPEKVSVGDYINPDTMTIVATPAPNPTPEGSQASGENWSSTEQEATAPVLEQDKAPGETPTKNSPLDKPKD